MPAENESDLDAGRRQHGRKAATERLAGFAIAVGRLLMIAAVTVLVLWVLRK